MEENRKMAILKLISLSELYITIILLVLSISMQNTYLLLILGSLFTKQIPEQIFKRLSDKFNWSIGKRPEGAVDCDSMNSGGPAKGSGIISGHVFNLSSLTFFLIYSFTENSRTMTTKEATLIGILFIFIFSLVYARIELHCHTKEQTVIGFIGGAVWGYVMFLLVNFVRSKSDRLQVDKSKISGIINGCQTIG